MQDRNFTENGVGVVTGPSGERWIVSPEDFTAVRHLFWHDNGEGYARASTSSGEVYLHRLLLPNVKTVDHIDQDRHNCLRHNLRDGSGINQLNSPKRAGTKSRFRGVSAMRDHWQARVNLRGQRYHLGTFASEDEAGAAVRSFMKQQGRAAFY